MKKNIEQELYVRTILYLFIDLIIKEKNKKKYRFKDHDK